MSERYILRGKIPVIEPDTLKWARWCEAKDRHVALDKPSADVTVSTVFLGLDYQFGDGPPLLFESMIFGGAHDQELARCSTWDEAEAQHIRMVTEARK